MGGYSYADDNPSSNADPSGLECAAGASSNGSCNDQPVQDNGSGSSSGGSSGDGDWGDTGSYGGIGQAPGTGLLPPSAQAGFQAAFRRYSERNAEDHGSELELDALDAYCGSVAGGGLCGRSLTYEIWGDYEASKAPLGIFMDPGLVEGGDLGEIRYVAMEETDAGFLADIGGGGDPDLSVKDPGAVCGGESFAAGTRVLLASGRAVPISSVRRGEKVLAVNVRTGRAGAEDVAAVLVHYDTDRYDLRVRTAHGTVVIQTTSRHLFWDPSLDYGWIPAKHLKPGMHFKTPDGQSAVVVGGSVPAVHDGWMWDLTVPGNNDHDFYVAVAATAVLVHNCTEGEETANNIANHANERAQAGDGTHYVSGVSPQELPGHVHQVLDGEVPGIETRYLSNGRVGYWDPATRAVVVEDGAGNAAGFRHLGVDASFLGLVTVGSF